MGNRSTAEARFIGEDAALEAHQDHLNKGSGGGCLTREGIGENQLHGRVQFRRIGEKNEDTTDQIGDRHEWHDR